MIAELNYPVKSLKGKLGKQYYARVQYGKVVIQRRPKRDKPPTEAQKRTCDTFAKKIRREALIASLAFPLPLRYH